METNVERKLTDAIVARLPSADGRVGVYIFGDEIIVSLELETLTELDSNDRPSNVFLSRLRKHLEKIAGQTVSLVISEGDITAGLENALLALLASNTPGIVQKVFISSLRSKEIDVWVVPSASRRSLSPKVVSRIRTTCVKFIEASDHALRDLCILQESPPLPSLLAILRAIKIGQPLDANAISERLSNAGFALETGRWLGNRLDELRHKGFVRFLAARRSDEAHKYALTSKGLDSVPTSLSSSSSDVQRALDLGRRRW